MATHILSSRWGIISFADKLKVALGNGEKLTYYGAEAEVIADASEYMLQDSKFVKNLETGLKGKIKGIVQTFLDKVNEAFKRLGLSGHFESRILRTMQDGVAHYEKNLQSLWDLAFDELLGAEVIKGDVADDSYGNIQKSAREQTDTLQFRRWFEGSQVVNEDDEPRIVYHTTRNEFTEFDPDKIGESAGHASDGYLAATAHLGYWFNTQPLDNRGVGNNVIKVYLSAQRLREPGTLDGLTAEIWDVYSLQGYEYDTEDPTEEQAKEAGEVYRNWLESNGYDGIAVADTEFGGTSYVVFEPTQIKSADPVTYDDSGNVIPLSERFNAAYEDIRYSHRSDYQYTVDGARDFFGDDDTYHHFAKKASGTIAKNPRKKMHMVSVTQYGDDIFICAVVNDGNRKFHLADVAFIDVSEYNGRISTLIDQFERMYIKYGKERTARYLGGASSHVRGKFFPVDRGRSGGSTLPGKDGQRKGLYSDQAGVAAGEWNQRGGLPEGSSEVNDTLPVSSLPETRQFSLRSSVEKREDGLMAIHNLNARKLLDTLRLGGFPMPSIAIVKAKQGHTMYGDYSVIFGVDTIDPKGNADNRVYGNDAWTPIFPPVETELDSDRVFDLRRDTKTRVDDVDGYLGQMVSRFYNNFVGESITNETENSTLEKAWRNEGMLAAYLLETGSAVQVLQHEVPVDRGYKPEYAEIYDAILGVIGDADTTGMSGGKLLEVYGEQLAAANDALNSMWQRYNAGDRRSGIAIINRIGQAKRYNEAGGALNPLMKTENDYDATAEAMRNQINQDSFDRWMLSKLNRIFKRKGIYNGKERFTSSGARKSWKATHYDYTVDMVGTVLDRFGREVTIMKADDRHFRITVPVAISPQFYGWVFGLKNYVTNESPPEVVEGMKDMLSAVEKRYKGLQ